MRQKEDEGQSEENARHIWKVGQKTERQNGICEEMVKREGQDRMCSVKLHMYLVRLKGVCDGFLLLLLTLRRMGRDKSEET